MIFYLGIIKDNQIIVTINNNNQIIAKGIFIIYRQTEKLLFKIDKLLKNNKIKLNDLKGIEVDNSKGSFTSLRVCVAIANAFGYALNIPVRGISGKTKIINECDKKFNIVEPIYERKLNVISN